MPLSAEKRLLLDRVQNAIRASGWNIIFENDEHPTLLRLFRDNEQRRLLVYIWRLTPGGPAGVRPGGEYRIQLTGVNPPLQRDPGFTTVLLGWHQSTGMFVGFDVSRRPQQWGRSPSVQVRFAAIEQAAISGFGIHRRATGGQGEIAVAFTPENFMEYVERQSQLHEFADNPQDTEVLQRAARGAAIDLDRVTGHGRRQAIRAVMERVGQGNFRARILAVYHHTCAICPTQLELIEAAHIVPVPAGGTNDTPNGVALCALHHEAYDRSLIGIGRRYDVMVSSMASRRLARLGRDSGLAAFQDTLQDHLTLPTRAADRPSPDLLEEGLRLRAWTA